MSFFSDFEGRIAALFDTAPQGYVEPFSFKRLAKRAAKEMEAETYEIDGDVFHTKSPSGRVSSTRCALVKWSG